ncbi:MAG: anti-sigma factor antagonist [Deltaproteobacteria bacterium]|nr:MAG: anti-sigma factor antagonist [Deltaproteobacteria bacterium]
MSQKFQATVHQRDDVTFVKLAGVIDEDNELSDLVDKIGKGTCVIDLGEVERINSCGVRDWVNWLGKIESAGAEVVLVECSPAIVAQINLVNNFTGKGVVKSFYVPYFCPECDEEKVLLCETADMGPPPHEPPTCRCDECDLVMDFDDMPDSYFAFLANQKKIADAGKVDQVISEFNPGDGEKSKIRSRVGSTSLSGASLSSSLPSVPSLPSISRSSAGLGTGAGSRPGSAFTGTGSRPGFGTSPGSNPGTLPGSPPDARAAAVAPRSGAVVYVLVGVLVLAIVVLGVLLFAK